MTHTPQAIQADSIPPGPWLLVDPCSSELERSQTTLERLIPRAIDATCDYLSAEAMLERDHAVVIIEVSEPHAAQCLQLAAAALRRKRAPLVVLTGGVGCPALLADLMLLGSVAYLPKPLSPEQIALALPRLFDTKDICRRAARLLVGRLGLKDAQWLIRGMMGREALARAGSRRAAALLLEVDRRYVARLSDEFSAAAFETGT